MTSREKSRFISDRRTPQDASWRGGSDWVGGTVEGVEVVGDGLVGRDPREFSEIPDSVSSSFEDGDLSEYANAADFSTVTTRAFDGSVSITSNTDSHQNMWWGAQTIESDEVVTVSARLWTGVINRGGPTLVDSVGSGYAAYADNHVNELRIHEVTEDGLVPSLTTDGVEEYYDSDSSNHNVVWDWTIPSNTSNTIQLQGKDSGVTGEAQFRAYDGGSSAPPRINDGPSLWLNV